MTLETTTPQVDPAASGDTDGAANNAASGDADNKPIMIPKSRLDQEINKRRAIEAQLQDVADELVQDIPEEYRALVPDLLPAQKIKWLKDAKASGLFSGKAKASVPVTDTKAPATTPRPMDTSKLSPMAKLSMAYRDKAKG